MVLRLGKLARTVRADVVAGVTVAFVAIPQSLAYAELAGLPAFTGIVALAAAAIAASFFASAPHLQAGPVVTTALLTFAILSSLVPVGSASYLGAAVLLSLIVGTVRVAIGVFRLGAVAYLLAQPVMLGFVSAAAVLILVSQVPPALGVSAAGMGMIEAAVNTLVSPGTWRPEALLVASLTIAVSLLAPRLHPLLPGVLISLIAGLLYSHFFDYQAPVVGEIPSATTWPLIDLPFGLLPGLVLGGVMIALLGFSEAAVIARTYAIVDRRRWNANREFISQGVANIASGLAGAFPVGASFSRSAINRLAGAKTRWSGLITGLTVLAILPLVGLLEPLPRATLAGIVIASVLGLLKPGELWRLREYSRPQSRIAWVTFVITLLFAPRVDIALLLGIGLTIAHHLWREQRVIVDVWVEESTLHLRPRGVLWFGSAPLVEEALNDALDQHREATTLALHLGRLGRIDLSAAMMLGRLMDDAREAGLKVECIEVPPMAKSWINRVWRLDERELCSPLAEKGDEGT